MKYFEDNKLTLYLDDVNERLKKLDEKSVNMIFADPPYFLSNNGVTCQSGEMVSVNKAKWDESSFSPLEKLSYNQEWIRNARRVLKDDGTIWISGTFHNIYYVGVALELEGFSIINNITWKKTNPPPNLACRAFTHSTETILWARKQLKVNKKGNHLFNYKDMKVTNDNKQMKDVWEFSITKKSEKSFGKHPTQKPLALLERIILTSTKENDLILDPFNGSGTTGIAAIKLKRNYIGIDNEVSYLELTKKRYLGGFNE